MAEFPALPLWTDAYIADTQHLTNEEHGVYLRLLMAAWRSPGCSLPDDDRRLALMVGATPKKWASLRPIVSTFWTIEAGTWTQKRLTAERDFVEGRSRSGRAGASARWEANRLKKNNTGDAVASPQHVPERCESDTPIPTPIREEREAKASQKKTAPDKLSEAVMMACAIDPDDQKNGWARENVPECVVIWLALGLTPPEIIETARQFAASSPDPVTTPRALDDVMSWAASAKRKPKPDPKGTRLDPEWFLPREWGQWALAEGMTIPEVRAQADVFKDYWISAPAAKARKADWQAVWRNWIRKYLSDRPTTGGRNGRVANTGLPEGGQRPDPALANIARLAGLGQAPGNGGAGTGGSGEEAGPVRLGP